MAHLKGDMAPWTLVKGNMGMALTKGNMALLQMARGVDQ